MAGFFDQFLAKVSTEDQTVLNKYPELRQSVEKMETDIGQLARYAGEWEGWKSTNWDPDSGMTRAEKALRDELSDAQARLAAGVSQGASAQTVEALRKEFDAKVEQVQKQSLSAIEGMNMFYQGISSRILPHQQEFHENLDPKTLMAYMQANKINDPDIAYDKMVAGKRAELAAASQKELEAKHAADITAAEQKGYEKRAQEAAMGPNGFLPTDNTGGIAGVTARIDQPAKLSDEVKAKIGEAKLGDGSLAQLGYEAFRRGELPIQ